MGKNSEIVKRCWELMESGRLDGLADVWAPDVEFKAPGTALRGIEQIRPFLEVFFTAFPDLKHQVVTTTEGGDAVALELRVTGTHTRPLRTPNGEVPPTGRKVVWETCDVIRVKNGKVTAWHAYWDQVAFLTQLGLMPAAS